MTRLQKQTIAIKTRNTKNKKRTNDVSLIRVEPTGHQSDKRQVHNFVQSAANVTRNFAVSGAGTFITFSLSDMDDLPAFQTLFDQYRLMAVEVEFQAQGNVSVIASTAGAAVFFATAFDFDDNIPPSSIANIRQYTSFKQVPCTRSFKRTLVPACALFVGTTGGAQAPKTQQWIDIVHSTVGHYGLKTFLEGSTTTGIAYNIVVKYHWQFRQVR